MNGREFIDCATRLSQSSHNADLRSAISRAYYGAFHAARDFVEDCGMRFSTNTTEAHTKMSQCFDNSNIFDIQSAGRLLKTLREHRNSADYSLNDAMCEDIEFVQFCLKASHHIINTLDQVVAQPNIHDNVRSILRNCAKPLGIRVV